MQTLMRKKAQNDKDSVIQKRIDRKDTEGKQGWSTMEREYQKIMQKENQPDLILLPIERLPGPSRHENCRDPILDLQQTLHPALWRCASSKPGMELIFIIVMVSVFLFLHFSLHLSFYMTNQYPSSLCPGIQNCMRRVRRWGSSPGNILLQPEPKKMGAVTSCRYTVTFVRSQTTSS